MIDRYESLDNTFEFYMEEIEKEKILKDIGKDIRKN